MSRTVIGKTGGNGTFFEWKCISLIEGAVASGQFSIDDADPAAGTSMKIHKTELNINTDAYISGSAYITFRNQETGFSYLYLINSITDNTTYYTLSLTVKSGGKLSEFILNETYSISFTKDSGASTPLEYGGMYYDWQAAPTSTSPGSGYFSFNNASASATTVLDISKVSQTSQLGDMAGYVRFIKVTNILNGDEITFDITSATENVTFTFWQLVVVAKAGNTLTSLVTDGVYRISFIPLLDAEIDGINYVRRDGGWSNADSTFATLSHTHLPKGMAFNWECLTDGGTPTTGNFSVDDNSDLSAVTEIKISKEAYHAAATSYDTGDYIKDIGKGYVKITLDTNYTWHLFKIDSVTLISSTYYFLEVTPVDGRLAALTTGYVYELSFTTESPASTGGNATIEGRSYILTAGNTEIEITPTGSILPDTPVVTMYDMSDNKSVDLGKEASALGNPDAWIERASSSGKFKIHFDSAFGTDKTYFVTYIS